MKITIITPSFNSERFIEQTIRSVVDQRGEFQLEYLVIDGGSTDRTIDILRSYEDKLRWISERDNGQSDAINKGLRLATGDIIAFLNSDDVYFPGALDRVNRFFETSQRQWVFGKCDIIDESNKRVQQWITAYKNFFIKRYSYNKLLAENFISQPASFWRRSILNEVGFFDEDEHYVMDYDYWLRIGKLYEPGYIDQYLASFRWQSSSKSRTGFKQQFADELRVAKKYAGQRRWPIALHAVNYYKIIIGYRLIEWSQRQRSAIAGMKIHPQNG